MGRSIHNDEELESSDTEPEDKAEESDEETDNAKKNEAANDGQESSADEKGRHGQDGSSWTLRLDKEIKDLENSAIASSKYFSHGLGLEHSLKNIENSLKNTQSRVAGYARPGDNPKTECEEKEEIEDSTTTSAGVCGISKRRETTPPHIAVALKEAATMREEAKKRERHYNPRVADALEKMEAMGYTDNDGWLTQLLVMKHGNIGEVLEILTPVQK